MGKWIKLGNSVIEKYKSVLSLPKNQKKIKQLFCYGDMSENL